MSPFAARPLREVDGDLTSAMKICVQQETDPECRPPGVLPNARPLCVARENDEGNAARGVPWSKRMRTGRDGLGSEALRDELEHGRDLLARHLELLHDLINAEVLEAFDDRGHGKSGALEHPGAAPPAEALRSASLSGMTM